MDEKHLLRSLADVAMGSPLFLTAPLLRRWHLRWGATGDELAAATPGDEVVERESFRATRAITIDAPPELVAPDRANWPRTSRPLVRANTLEERVTEGPVLFGGSVKVRYPSLPILDVDQPKLERPLPYSLHHGRERIPREALNQPGAARIRIDQFGNHMNVPKTHGNKERIQPTTDQRVAPSSRLEIIQTLDDSTGEGAVRVKAGGAVIALDHSNGPAGLDRRSQPGECLVRIREVFKDKAYKGVVEGRRPEGEIEYVRPLQSDVRDPFARQAAGSDLERLV